jgi:hypothetical protein
VSGTTREDRDVVVDADGDSNNNSLADLDSASANDNGGGGGGDRATTLAPSCSVIFVPRMTKASIVKCTNLFCPKDV